ncbi:hypothetical protein PTI45_03382 [Paenibacillus nuruki]|uniref:HNH domain-containing protein n=1 Tax=Paenibacillus nuruki TaxID=1886670 RepID=A0A1E3L0D3_9BACL|nr:HNH endonuclease [Paenibacillus nuruki]ODP27257.1 hypothetical protein PTI45_03382 [Paenibacillus nuruki]
MKNLIPYQEEPIDIFKRIAHSKKEETRLLLLNEENFITVWEQYKLFNDNLDSLHVLINFLVDYSEKILIKEAFLHCYDSSTKALEEMKSCISNLQSVEYGMKCQYCCIDTPITFDHYLPKSQYPELSINPLNLIPCCASCNLKKREKWIDDNNNRLFLNMYYDILPSKKFLFAKLIYDNNDLIPSVKFYLNNREQIDNTLFCIISSHFLYLNLLDNYSKLANGTITTHRMTLLAKSRRSTTKVTIEDVELDLQDEAESKRKIYGNNFWEASLLDAMQQSENFIRSCLT